MFIWLMIILILTIAIWAMCFDIKIQNKSKELDVKENQIKEHFKDVIDSLK
ncbi:hypothetical protein [Clostridium botulinum]|uniref:hypothetical protein n=1 Tax=Clostridium botulinum TaxID=1491 RepID=UPI001C9B99ED|nr:hypothetical protein [Clostridium botulinum]MBY6838706.1 hypothetical protein [Clostridium botulinum]